MCVVWNRLYDNTKNICYSALIANKCHDNNNKRQETTMQPRIHVVTLGTKNLIIARQFYERVWTGRLLQILA